MKILHVLYSGLGGHGNVFFSMADADKEKRNTYEALFYGIEDIREDYIAKAESRGIKWYAVKKNAGADLEAGRRVRKIVKESGPDIIFSHGTSPIFFIKKWISFRSSGMKVVVRETQPNHLKSRPEWIGLAFALLFADKVVFLTEDFCAQVKKKLPLFFSKKRTQVIPNGIDLDLFKPAPALSSRYFQIGMQSRLSETKDHPTLIRAFHLCLQQYSGERKLRLLIAGDGSCRSELEKLVHELNISDHVVFTGLLEEKDLPGFINSLDIYVHASLGETMSTALMQVMACKLPVIASDVFGINNMVQNNRTGILVPALNEKEMSGTILSLMNNPELAAGLARTAHEFAVNNYSNTLMLERYQKVFFDICPAPRKP